MGEYKTEPIKCWEKAKELRLEVYRRVAKARDEGRMVIVGGMDNMVALPAGFDMEYLGGEPYGASCAFAGKHDISIVQERFEAAEAAGYPRDLCTYLRLGIGSLLIDKYVFGGEYPKPLFSLQTHVCDTHGKWYQNVGEIEGIPYNAIDMVPYLWEIENESEESKKLKRDYVTEQLLDAIDWMEKVTGKDFDDEKFINAVHNECESTSLWPQCCMYNQAVPAPMDEKMMYSFYIIPLLARHWKEGVEFLTELRDELKDRVDRGIAAVPNERFRLMHDSQPPWFALEIFRHLEKNYGAVSIGAHYSFGLSAAWAYDAEKDTYLPARPPREAGVELRTREEACEWYAEWYLAYHTLLRSLRFSGRGLNKRIMDIVKNWHIDGAIIHLNRGCEGSAVGQMELHYHLSEQGVPCMTYEGNMADVREFDYERTIAKIDTFMETLDLKKLS
ncbi:MAG: 2-hydroxyacyl-CoA dehydratase family protein [Thermodesulfobacteriota bacterium]|nr:2-hydroxyacyl-CoA dehydratase family protein [Thermodesulfobacteriota bacterium]